jgi:AcrR family transcriptional regulator
VADVAGNDREAIHSRERLLLSAAELVATRGYAGTSVEAITSRAGVVKSALYWHFRNKDELIATALERRATEWIEGVERASEGLSDPAERLGRLLELTRKTVVGQSPPVRLIYALLAERGEQDPLLRQSIARIFERLRVSIIQSTSELLDLPAERFEGLALVLTSALHGVIFDYLANPDEAWLDRWLQSIRDMIGLMLKDIVKQSRQ